MRRTVLALGILLACTAGVSAHEEGGDVEEARKAIEAANAKYSEAVKRQDATALAGFYTPDCILLPPDQAMIRGGEGVAPFWAEVFKGGVKGLKLMTVDVERRGDLAIETGSFTMTSEPPGKVPAESAGKYVVVWKRQKDGSWKLHRDIWNGAPATK